MAIIFNADEILQAAEQIERNGAQFYILAADRLTEFGGVFRKLAGQEEKHLAVFQKMRSSLSAAEREETAYDPDNQSSLYLKTMADREVFNVYEDQTKLFFPSISVANIIDIAIGKEKDSIVFYVGLKELAPENIGGAKLDLVISEEFSHIAVLRGMLMGR